MLLSLPNLEQDLHHASHLMPEKRRASNFGLINAQVGVAVALEDFLYFEVVYFSHEVLLLCLSLLFIELAKVSEVVLPNILLACFLH